MNQPKDISSSIDADHRLALRCDSRGSGLEEAWKIINVLHMDAMDKGESWQRALDWLNQWGDFAPNNHHQNQ